MEPAVRGRLSHRFGWGAFYVPLLFLPAPTRLAESVEMTRPAVRTWVGDAYSRWRRAPGGRCTLYRTGSTSSAILPPPLDIDRSPAASSPRQRQKPHPQEPQRAATSADRRPPGLARSARAQDALPRSDARVGNQPARPAALRQGARGEPGLALSGAAAAGERGADHEQVGHDRQQPPR